MNALALLQEWKLPPGWLLETGNGVYGYPDMTPLWVECRFQHWPSGIALTVQFASKPDLAELSAFLERLAAVNTPWQPHEWGAYSR